MSEQSVQQYVKSYSFKKIFFSFIVNKSLKECNKIENYLLNNNYLSKSDSKLNLIISDGLSIQSEDSYFLYGGSYNKDGSKNPIRKYSIINKEIVECTDLIKCDITIVDLYEESLYLHSCSNNGQYITGYIIKEIIKSKTNKTLIFSNEKVKLYIKNTNKLETISLVDNFISDYII